MTDPISIAAGVVGILSAAAHLSTVLGEFVQSTREAPYLAPQILTEVNDIRGVLSQLQAFILRKEALELDRASLLQVDHVISIVTGCVLTFSKLERLVDELRVDNIHILDRFKWARHRDVLQDHIQRLQGHKASLSLILIIINASVQVQSKGYTY